MIKASNLLFTILLLSITFQGCQKETKKEYAKVSTENIKSVDGYVGDQNCKSCHEQAYSDWIGSHHDKAMQIVDESTVLGNFDSISKTLDGVDYLFYRKGEEYHVSVREIDGSEKDYTVSDVFGIEPLQQYMVDFPKGRKQVLRASWDTEKKTWFHQYNSLGTKQQFGKQQWCCRSGCNFIPEPRQKYFSIYKSDGRRTRI